MKFKKKPVEIEAVKVSDVLDGGPYPVWVQEAIESGTLHVGKTSVLVKTLEGDHTGQWSDWLIRGGKKGELYPCKPDIFSLTYDEVEPPDKVTSMPEDERLAVNFFLSELERLEDGIRTLEKFIADRTEHGDERLGFRDPVAKGNPNRFVRVAGRELALVATKLQEARCWLREAVLKALGG